LVAINDFGSKNFKPIFRSQAWEHFSFEIDIFLVQKHLQHFEYIIANFLKLGVELVRPNYWFMFHKLLN
jgi:hypothetical protein